MKKIIIVLFLLFAATVVFAQSIKLPDQFPVGKWKDANYDATWEFTSSSIKVTDNKTGESYSLQGRNLEPIVGMQPGLKFQNADPNNPRTSYSFKAALPGTDVLMEIERPGLAKYTATLKKQ